MPRDGGLKPFCRSGIERDSGLVQEPDRSGRGEKARETEPAHLPLGKMGRPVVRQIEEIEGVESGLRSFQVAPAAIIALPEAHIFDDGQPRLNPVRMTDIVQEAFSACVALGAANPHTAGRRTQIGPRRTSACPERTLNDKGSTTMRPPRWQASPSTAIAVTAAAREGDVPERANGLKFVKLNSRFRGQPRPSLC